MINIDKIVIVRNWVLKGIGSAFRLFFWVVVIGLCLIWIYDQDGSCIDVGGVWDNVEKRCRYDCLTWNEEDGCVPLEKKN